MKREDMMLRLMALFTAVLGLIVTWVSYQNGWSLLMFLPFLVILWALALRRRRLLQRR